MPYDLSLAERIRHQIEGHPHFTEKKMFGGLSFLYHGKMCVGVLGEDLIVRVVPGKMQEVLARNHAGPMAFTGKPMKEFVQVSPDGCSTEEKLKAYLSLGLEHARWKTGME